jgi:hypothetical protein
VCVAVDREVVQAGVLGAPVKSHCRHGGMPGRQITLCSSRRRSECSSTGA